MVGHDNHSNMEGSQQKGVIFFLFLCFISFLPHVATQTCEVWNQEPSVCSSVLSSYIQRNVSVASNITEIRVFVAKYPQAVFSSQAGEKIALVDNPLVPTPCRAVLIEWICFSALRACDVIRSPSNTSQVVAVLPSQSCRPLCEEVNLKCKAFVESLGSETDLTLPNCTGDPDAFVTGLSGYPLEYTSYPLGPNVTYRSQCSSGRGVDIKITVTPDDIDCGPLEFNEKAYPPCSEPCLSPVFTKSQWKAANYVTLVLCLISFTSTLILLIIFLSQKRYYKMPRNIHMFMTLGSNFIAAGFGLGPLYNVITADSKNQYKAWCKDDLTKSDFNVGVCVVSGALAHFGILILSFWWLCLSVYLLVTIKAINLSGSKFGVWTQKHLKVILYCFGWGGPLAGTTIALAARKIDFPGYLPWCFVSIRNGTGWEMGLFYALVLAIATIGTVIMIAVIVRIKIISSLPSYGSGGKETPRIPPHTFRIVALLFIFVFIYAFVIGNRFHSLDTTSEVKASLQEYITCYLKNQFSDTKEKCEWKEKLSPVTWMMSIVNASIQGFLLFGFFGLTHENWKVIKKIWSDGSSGSNEMTRVQSSFSKYPQPSGRTLAESDDSNNNDEFNLQTMPPPY